MSTFYLSRPTLFVILLQVFFSGSCKKDDSNPAAPDPGGGSGKIVTGASVDAGSMQIGPGGGNFLVAKPGTPIDGMQIEVPPNAFSDQRSFQVSYAPILNHQLGELFTPISPLITISNGGGYADSVMYIRIPVTRISPEEVAMAFYYDPATGELEGLPLVSRDSTSLTIVTRHFSSSSSSGTQGIPGLMKYADVGRIAKIVAAKAARALLRAFGRTGFQPHVDEWHFVNHGSTITSRGNCGGLSASAIWYFIKKKSQGSPSLWGQFDNDGNWPTPKLWQDDVLAYKFVTMVQMDLPWTNVASFLNWIVETATPTDEDTFWLFTYATVISKKPALVCLNGPDDAAHAAICYATAANTLFIVDSNDPGNEKHGAEKTITLEGSYFGSYLSSLRSGGPDIYFNKVRYGGNSALVDFDEIGERWQQMVDKAIGDGVFPTFTLEILNDEDEYVPFTNGYSQHKRTISLRITGKGVNSGMRVYDENQDEVEQTTTSLTPGKHKIGISAGDDAGEWVGFQWVEMEIESDSSIVPLAIGNEWHYSETDYGSDGRVTATHTRLSKVIGTTIINEKTWYQLEESVDGGTPAVTLFSNYSNGLWAVQPPGNPFLVYQYPARAGEAYLMGTSASVRVDTVGATRTMPAGTFNNCVVYTIQYGPSLPYTVRTFAPGIGQVETRDYERVQGGGSYLYARIQLTSYALK